MRGARLAGILAMALPLLGGAGGVASADISNPVDLKAAIEQLGGQPCGNMTCVALDMPLDHDASGTAGKIKITFSVSFASEESKGILFYVVGGPGGSGVGVAEDYLGAFDERLTQNMDLVFFDQRGVGPEHGIECPAAQGIYDTADLRVEDPDGAIGAAKTFAADCVAELKSRDLLPLVATDQAIRDLELFRAAIGSPQVWIYGESYGTQFAQQYATAFPAAVKGVVIDGVVDLALSFSGYYESYTESAERILARVLESCQQVPGCREDMRGEAAQVYDQLAARLAQAPIELDFPLGDGTIAKRHLTAAMLSANAFYSLYGPDDRPVFLRALAAASRGELLPMLRLAYSTLVVDPQTEAGIADPTWFGAAYYAITCSDYAEGGEDRDANARQILAEAQAFAPRAKRLLRLFYAERLACAYWPVRGDDKRPQPFAGGDYPTLILNADTDPITPITMSYSVLDHVKNGYLVTMKGGPHVIWGRGLTCPDEIVYSLLFDGTLPEAQEQVCEQDFIGAYEPLTLTGAGDADDAFVLARALETEIAQSPEFYNWDGGDSLAIGCDHGGTVEISAAEEGTAYGFAKCAWWPGIAIDGTGIAIDEGAENIGLTLDLAVSGAHQGQITFRHNSATDAMTLNGTYDGKVVATPRPLP